MRRFARAVDDVCNIITATRHAGKERVDGNTVKGLEKRETVVKEVDHVATVLLVTHENGVIGEIQRFQGLRITGRGRRNGERGCLGTCRRRLRYARATECASCAAYKDPSK